MPKPQIILISSLPVFNHGLVPAVGNMQPHDASTLFYLLLKNIVENIAGIKSEYELGIFLDTKDQDYIPEDFVFPEFRFFDPSSGYKTITSYISGKVHSGNTQFIVLYGNTMGFSPKEYDKVLNLLNYDDNSLVLGKSPDERLSMIGFNYFDEALFHKLHQINPDVNDYLLRVTPLDYYLFVQSGYQFIYNIDDFRHLYRILSTRESIDYCSHEIHEQFTHLFIEYKESL